ncbi:MAG: phosphate ABC transporter permease PstA [bacterium]
MERSTRKILNRSFSGLGVVSVLLLALSLIVILAPMMIRGAKAYFFRATTEHREMILDVFERGDREEIAAEAAEVAEARQPVYDMIDRFEAEMDTMGFMASMEYGRKLDELKDHLRELLGPLPDDREPALIRDRYGETRWDRAQEVLYDVMFIEEWDYSDPDAMGTKVYRPRVQDFEGTSLAALFPYVEENMRSMLHPRFKFYWRFLFDTSEDAHFFGGIWPEVLGTIYLTLGALLFAIPMGVISAIYLTEYAHQGRIISIIRTSINTLAGVPSIVFGLFGLAFFINGVGVSASKSVLAGSLTLGLLIMPVVIRASEEAILAVPIAYKEAALGLGAGKWHTVLTVVLPAALPGILTGIVISMGRAAGETAPIIFTAAVSVGQPLGILDTLNEPTPALPWNIYNMATEHEAVDQLRHVQFGMVATLVALVLTLNMAAIILRARIGKKLKG